MLGEGRSYRCGECHVHTTPRPRNLAEVNPSELDVLSALRGFRDAISLWRLAGGVRLQDVIDAAIGCLVTDLDGEALRMLAGASARDSIFELEPLILKAVAELEVGDVLEGPPQLGALVVMARRHLEGNVSARDLASWAHTHIRHDGPLECEPLVVLDDMYDTVEYSIYNEEELDRWTTAEASALVHGLPSPGVIGVWRGEAMKPNEGQLGERRRWRKRSR